MVTRNYKKKKSLLATIVCTAKILLIYAYIVINLPKIQVTFYTKITYKKEFTTFILFLIN